MQAYNGRFGATILLPATMEDVVQLCPRSS
jgi:hypothetical protein